MQDVLWPGCAASQVVRKVLTANFVCDPLFFFPAFYTLKELANPATTIAQSLADPVTTVSDALAKYRKNFLQCIACDGGDVTQDWQTSWSFWLPGHAISFGVMPPHLRFPWMAAVSFGYCGVLSYTRGHVLTETPALMPEEVGSAPAPAPAPAIF
eukprot:9470895-Pyramimonas_sp.AAC.1